MAVENKVTQSVTTALNYLTRRVGKIASKEVWIYNIGTLNKYIISSAATLTTLKSKEHLE